MIDNIGKFIIKILIKGYQYGISPLFPLKCRFGPSCSDYALEAVEKHGAVYGGWLTFKRICRCHPWGGHGFDPVPTERNRRSKI